MVSPTPKSFETIVEGKMSIINAVTFVVRPENQNKATQLLKELKEHFFNNKEVYKEIKSMNLFTQLYGGTYGTYVDLEEYDSFAACEEAQKTMEKDEVIMKIYRELMELIEPSTLSINVWKATE
jgi:hypothetical protein